MRVLALAILLLATPVSAAELTPQEKAYLAAIVLGLIDRGNIECSDHGRIDENKRWEALARLRATGGDVKAAMLGAEVMMWVLRSEDICRLVNDVAGPRGKYMAGAWIPHR